MLYQDWPTTTGAELLRDEDRLSTSSGPLLATELTEGRRGE